MSDPWKRKVVIGDCTLLLGDCLSIMPHLGKVNAVIADPPYELSSSGPGKSHFGMSLSKFDGEAYKSIVSGVDYCQINDRISDICNPFNMFCFCSNKQISKLMTDCEGRGYSTTLVIWHKTNAAPFANGVWRGDIEYVVHARGKGAIFKGGAVEKKKVTELPLVIDSAHPTVKPQEILKKYVKICSNTGDTILDPFMGSGTTGVACVKLGRKFIGIEISEDYFDIAVKRIQGAYNEPDMFLEAKAPEATQDALFVAEKSKRPAKIM